MGHFPKHLAIRLVMLCSHSESLPRLAIIIPVFRHSVLVSEALQSALDQRTEFGIHIVAINDGCPNPETDLVLSAIASAHPDRITYLRKSNGGLSSARNFGIAHVLAHLPSIEALFMLDADNRLRPQAMGRAMAVLDETEEADWVYPSIDMFGIKARCDYGGPYSRLIHSEMNICEAGSLIRRRVFERGVLFDESYTLGFEDWHFFLQAGDAGFQGVNLEEFGFFYRKRPESMLANADRNRDFLLGKIRQAHPDLFHPVAQAQLEQCEAPRFAIYLADEETVLLTTDPDMGTEVSLRDYERAYWQSHTTPMKHRVPPFLIATTRNLLDGLREAGLLHWALWQLEKAAAVHGLAYVTQRAPVSVGGIGWEPLTARDDSTRNTAVAWIVSTERLQEVAKGEEGAETLDGFLGAEASMSGEVLRLEHSAPAVTDSFHQCLGDLQASRYRAAGMRRWSWRQPSIMWRGKEHTILRKWFGGEAAFPKVPKDTYDIGLVVNAPSEVSPDLLNSILHGKGDRARLHLFVLGRKTTVIDPSLRIQLDSISLLTENGFDYRGPHRRQFNGLFLPTAGAVRIDESARGMLYWLDELHNISCSAASRLMGPLRGFGIITFLHIGKRIPQHSSAHIRLALAYEYAYDHIIAADTATSEYLCGMGIPSSKMKR